MAHTPFPDMHLIGTMGMSQPPIPVLWFRCGNCLLVFTISADAGYIEASMCPRCRSGAEPLTT